MKVITIKQPWASLIAAGYKTYEFRSWKTKYRGDILIHAGKGIDKEAMRLFKHLNLDYPKGEIIAKARITDCILVDEEVGNELLKKDPLVYHNLKGWIGYGFKLDNVKKIKPIKINGKLSLWEYNGEIKEI